MVVANLFFHTCSMIWAGVGKTTSGNESFDASFSAGVCTIHRLRPFSFSITANVRVVSLTSCRSISVSRLCFNRVSMSSWQSLASCVSPRVQFCCTSRKGRVRSFQLLNLAGEIECWAINASHCSQQIRPTSLMWSGRVASYAFSLKRRGRLKLLAPSGGAFRLPERTR